MSKRLFDLILVVLTSPVWAPVMIVTIVLMAVVEGMPIFYRSNRRVMRKLNMRILKFRTMVRNAEAICNREVVPIVNQRFLNTPADSPLFTPLGRWVERFQITELPQVLHVITGHMSIVGNRPLPENVIASLRELYPAVEDRFGTPAGLTGLVQLIGREEISDGERLCLESHYCQATDENYSARLDFLILVCTVLIVLRLIKPFTIAQAHDLIDRFSPGSWSGGVVTAQRTASSGERETT
ncbi:MAG: sugar transferase [Burkholderiaceae bacterium]|nr:sugar transferase [Burkholderiaceae bacterium]